LLSGLWFAQGHYREGRRWVEHALERSAPAAPLTRAQALLVAGMLAVFQADYDHAARFVDDAMAVVRELGDPHRIGEAMTYAAFVAYRRGAYGQAQALLRDAEGLLAHHPLVAPGALAIFGPGDVALAQEAFGDAVRMYQETITRLQAPRYAFSLSDAQAGLAAAYLCTGHTPQAVALYDACLQRSRDQGFAPLAVSALLGFAAVAVAADCLEVGAHLLGAAEGAAADLGLALFPRDRPVRDRALAALETGLGAERLAALRRAGQAHSIAQAAQEARHLVMETALAPPAALP
jgi:tetratricopeptide (TPR) repeat protein